MTTIAELLAAKKPAQPRKVAFEWDGDDGTMGGEFWLIPDAGLSVAAKKRVQTASIKGDVLELNICLLIDRVRFGETGEEKLNAVTARSAAEDPNPMFEAILDKAQETLKEWREAEPSKKKPES